MAPFFGLGGFGGVLWIAVLAVCIYIALQAKKLGRSGWWIYIICGLFFIVGVAATVAWFAHLKDHPWKWGSSITV